MYLTLHEKQKNMKKINNKKIEKTQNKEKWRERWETLATQKRYKNKDKSIATKNKEIKRK